MKTKIVGDPLSEWACVADYPNKSDHNICLSNTRRKPPFKCQVKPNSNLKAAIAMIEVTMEGE